jgi:hypothetical protein
VSGRRATVVKADNLARIVDAECSGAVGAAAVAIDGKGSVSVV